MTQSLNEERKNCKFDHTELTHLLYGGAEKASKILGFLKFMSEDPLLRNDPRDYDLSRIDMIKRQGERAKRVNDLIGLYDNGEVILDTLHGWTDIMPLGVNFYMFLPYIKYLGTDKQAQKWIPLIKNCEVIGTYAQTELSHGSDVRSLETTATYDHSTDEFIINSPTRNSMKFWPGELGLHANHVVCMAQLMVGEKKYGVHGFIVPIRDYHTNQPLPGIEVGDIGPKFGWNSKDNGYLIFKNVRIPRDNMLMRYSKINKEGKYSRRGNEKIGYAVMMEIRDNICHACYRYPAMALTIATRYSITRTQFHDSSDEKERKLLDYQIQQDKLVTVLSHVFAMNAGSHRITAMTKENLKKINENEDFSMMQDVHATLSGCKSFYTSYGLEAISTCRLACGGHGFHSYSGFTSIYQHFSPNATYEGENTVMALQTARYLVKCLQKLQKNKEIEKNVEYLKNLKEILSIKKCSAKKPADFDLEELSDVISANAAYLVYTAATTLMKGAQELPFKDAWDKKAGIALIEAARAHITHFTFRSFVNRIFSEVKCPQLKKALIPVCTLYGVDAMLRHPLGLIESSYVTSKQITFLRQRKDELLEEIRPFALGLIEGFQFHDNTLRTAIGQREGDPYEILFEWVKKYNAFNHYDWSEFWEKDVKGLRKAPYLSEKIAPKL